MTNRPCRGPLTLLVLTCVGIACSSPDSNASGSGGAPTSDGSSGGQTGSGGSSGASGAKDGRDGGDALPAGSLAGGWQKAFKEGGVGIACTMSVEEMKAKGAPAVTFGPTTIVVGFEQIGDNQDPVFARFDSGAKTYCEHHEREPPDGRALGVTWDGGPLAYVVYTIVGGGSAFDAKAKDHWLDRYGDGGGSSKVSFIGIVETQVGTLREGTFVIAKKKDGKTNSHSPTDAIIRLEDGRLELHGESAFQPMNPDRSIMECTDYPFFTKYVFTSDLRTLACASSTNCAASVPCP